MRELRGMDVAEDVLSVSARYGERETEEETDREIREIERANAGTRIQNRTQNPIAQTGERRSSVSFLAPKKNIYEERERERETFESAPGTPRRDPKNLNRTTSSRERRIERRTARVATVDDKANICFNKLFLVRA